MVIKLEVISATSVNVSWERLDIPEITGYIVYYSQTGNSESDTIVNVPSSTNFMVVSDLISSTEYQFEVVAVAELDGDAIVGERTGQHMERVIPTAAATERW